MTSHDGLMLNRIDLAQCKQQSRAHIVCGDVGMQFRWWSDINFFSQASRRVKDVFTSVNLSSGSTMGSEKDGEVAQQEGNL